MDVMKIKSKFVRGVLSLLIEKAIKKHLHADISVSIDAVELFHEDGNTLNFNVSVSGECTEKDIRKILNNLGL
jgi:hypothetical protein